jgi:succinate-acetate transporter protein
MAAPTLAAMTEGEAVQAVPQGPRIGDPGPLGVLAFSATTLMLGLYNANIADHNGAGIVIPVALMLAGMIQVLAAVLEVVRGNTFTAAVFGCFGPFWLIYGLIEDKYAAKIIAAGSAAKDASALTSALTVFLGVFGVLVAIFFVAALKLDAVLRNLLGVLVVAIALLAFGIHGDHEGMVHVSGYLTIVVAALGLYHGAAGLLAFTWERDVLPLGRRR